MNNTESCYCSKCWDLHSIRTHCIKTGRYLLQDGTYRSRFKCKHCNHTFSSTKGTPLYKSHLSEGIIARIIVGISQNHTITQISKDLGIRKATVCYWKKLIIANYKSFLNCIYRRPGVERLDSGVYSIFRKISKQKKLIYDRNYYKTSTRLKSTINKFRG